MTRHLKKTLAAIVGGATLLTLASIKPVDAISVGSPETQGKGKISVSSDNSFIFDRKFKFKGAENIDPKPLEDVFGADIESGYQVMLKTSYGVLDNLDVYAKLGWADYKIDSIFQGTRPTGTYSFPFIMNTDSNLAWGLGMKGKHELGNDWLLGCDLQYMRSKHDVKLTKKRTTEATGEFKSSVMQDWHAAFSLGKRIKNFLPYFGVRYSDARFETKGIEDQLVWGPGMDWIYNIKYKAKNNVGLFAGTDYKLGKNLSMNLEGRFIDETALTAGLTWKF